MKLKKLPYSLFAFGFFSFLFVLLKIVLLSQDSYLWKGICCNLHSLYKDSGFTDKNGSILSLLSLID